MKLIMESWRNYIAETEKENKLDCLYIFEGDSVNRVSFNERLNSLNESEDDFALFLEDWEKSVDHHFKMIEEAAEAWAPPPTKAGGAGASEEAVLATLAQTNKVLATGQKGAPEAAVGKLDRLIAWAKENPGKATGAAVMTLATIAGLGCAAAAAFGQTACLDHVKELLQGVDTPEAAEAEAVLDQAAEVPPTPEAMETIQDRASELSDELDAAIASGDVPHTTIGAEEAELVQQQLDAGAEWPPAGADAIADRMARDPHFRKAVEDAGGLEAFRAGGEGAGDLAAAGTEAGEAAAETGRSGVGQRLKKVFRRRR